MKTILFSALCVAAWIAVASSSRQCCTSPTFPADTSQSCRKEKCDASFGNLARHPPLVEFFDACRRNLAAPFPFIESLAACGQSSVNRTFFVNPSPSVPLNKQQGLVGSEAEVTGMFTLAYGCINKAKTSKCQTLQRYLRPTNGLLGLDQSTDANMTNSAFHGNPISLGTLLGQCTRPHVDAFAGSEWDGGLASCFRTGLSDNQASLSDYVARSAGDSCRKCDVSTGNSVPFCASFVSTSTTNKFGVHCAAQSAVHLDRTAQAFYTMWTSSGKARLHNKTLTIRGSNKDCSNFLRILACQTTMGQCSSDGALYQSCQSVCQNQLTTGCGVSASDAATVCANVGATRTSGCPATQQQVTVKVQEQEKVVESAKNFTVTKSKSVTYPNLKISTCLDTLSSSQGEVSSEWQTGFDTVLASLCRDCSAKHTVTTTTSCTKLVSAQVIFGNSDTKLTEEQLKNALKKYLASTVANTLTVSTVMVPVTELIDAAATAPGSASGASMVTASWIVIASVVLAAFF